MGTDAKHPSFDVVRRIGGLSQDGVFVFDRTQNRLVYVNAALVKIVEINRKVLLEEPALAVNAIASDDQEYVTIRYNELLQKEVVEDVQFRISRNTVEKRLSCNSYLAADKSFVVGFVKDLTRVREHEDYLINFGARKDALLDTVSQQLSTPLNLSRFTVDLIEKAVREKKYAKLNAHVEVMREVIAECIHVIDEFLIQEHIQSPDIGVKANRFDLVARIMIVLEKLKALNHDKDIRLRSDVQHLLITADDMKFFQIIHNLVSNAIKFSPPAGLIEIQVKDLKSRVQVIVRDNGIGIPEALQPYIYDRKTRASRPGLKGESSTGIGLHVTQRLVEMMGGDLTFESAEGKGTRFLLELPKDRG